MLIQIVVYIVLTIVLFVYVEWRALRSFRRGYDLALDHLEEKLRPRKFTGKLQTIKGAIQTLREENKND
jgi:predicted Holliday junction resolvase-like endonuclease